MVVNRQTFAEVLKLRRHLWNVDNYPATLPQVNKLYKNANLLLNAFLAMCFGLAGNIIMRVSSGEVPFPMHIPGWPYAKTIFTIQQLLLLYSYFAIILGPDMLFVGLWCEAHARIIVMRHRVARLDLSHEADVENFADCVKQHQIILEYLRKVGKMYNLTLLFQYFITEMSLCMHIYILTES